MRRKNNKFTEKIFLEALKNNSKDNPLNIDKYNKQEILDCRSNYIDKISFWIEFTCEDCKKSVIKNVLRKSKRYCNINFISYCRECNVKHTCLERYGVESSNSVEEIKRKKSDTCKQRYGVENISQAPEIKQKKIITSREHYNVDYPSQSEEIRAKVKQTCLERYGVENIAKSEDIKAKRRKTNMERYKVTCTFQSEELREKGKLTIIDKYGSLDNYYAIQNKKREKTNMERYGASYILQIDEFKDKRKQTCIERYGSESYLASEEGKKHAKEMMLAKYGVENCMQLESTKLKAKNTCIERYGTDAYTKSSYYCDYMHEKYGTMHVSYKYIYNNLSFDSSWELAFYIYHVDHNHNIIREPKYFEYVCNKTIHRYYPDFKVGNKYYEIKGEQFIKRNKNGKIIGFVHFGENNAQANAKYKCIIEHNINIIDYNKIQKYLRYITKTYGNNYLEQFVTTEKYGDKNDNKYNEE